MTTRPAAPTSSLPVARVLPLLTPAHLDRDFDYLVPPELDEAARPGVRVRVRFSGRLVDGFLLDRLARSDHPGALARLDRVVSDEVVLTPQLVDLVTAVARRYAGTRADVLRLAVPPRHAKVEAEPCPTVAAPAVDPTHAAAWARYTHGRAFVSALAEGRGPRAAWQPVAGEDWPARLAELAAMVAAAGSTALLIVPDQHDLDRVHDACVSATGPEHVVGLAAGLGPAQRYRRWLSALRGAARIVVGVRSAVFAPVPRLGLIAIWDDGDDTYADPRAPYPHSRDVAMLRAHESGAAFLAAGFARTAEIQAVVDSGWAHDVVAPRAVVRQCAPQVVAPGDSDVALDRDPLARSARLPAVAFAAARAALAAGRAVLVQVPRRGYVPSLACAKCRAPARCRHCNGPLGLPAAGNEAQPPACRWCGLVEVGFRCPACGSRSLRAMVVGAGRTAEELGRAFPGAVVRSSDGSARLDILEPGPQVVVATVGAEPVVTDGYGAALLLDGWALLGRADLRAAEQALRRWMAAAALVRSASDGGQVVVVADPAVPTVQALVRWDPVGHAQAQLAERAEVRFPPVVRVAAVDGTPDGIAALLAAAQLPDETEILGPVPLPDGARKPFTGESGDPDDVERMLLRVDRARGAALARALADAQAVRSARKSDLAVRVQIDPVDIG